MTISTKRVEELLRSQTSIARKVYEVLPNAPDSITAQGVVGKLRDSGVQLAFSAAQGILGDLASDRLAQGSDGRFCRTQVVAREQKVFVPPRESAPPPAESAPPPAEPAPLDCFAGIANRLRGVGRELTLLADEIETAALATEQARESAAQDGARLRQLRQLLMGAA